LTFRFIADHQDQWPVSWLCDALEVSSSGYYAWASRLPGPAEARREELLTLIQQVHADVRGRYGSPRMTAELKARGHACSENLVANLMKTHDIRAKSAKRGVRTTDSRHRLPVAANVLDRAFEPAEPNVAWSADITYIPTAEGWLFLAIVEDLFSRRIVGWAMDATMTSRLVVDALEMAIRSRLPGAGLITHSDRGSQYASEHYQLLLGKHGLVCSMSGVAQCWDNAPVESFFASLKRELVHDERYTTRAEAMASIFEYVEAFYNRVRLHSSLGYLSPAEFERTHHPIHR
jgi:transposase InsO family protein